MVIKDIRLQNFRSYADESFSFGPSVNLIIGPNGSGKTNLLEAVLVTALGSSYRVKDQDLIKDKKSWARLDANFDNQKRVYKLKLNNVLVEKSFLIGDKPYKRIGLEQTIPTVYFEPNLLQLFIRGPGTRRDWIDDLAGRTILGYKTLLGRYNRALAQRNSLLKKGEQNALSQLFAWDLRLSEIGSQIAAHRQSLIELINQDVGSIYSQIADKESKVQLEYKSHFPANQYATGMLASLKKHASLDFMRGFTAVGPHREDIEFIIGTKPAGLVASRGESRSLLLALKIIELKMIEAVRQTKALLLLDDVFSELDSTRRKALVSYLKDRQSIITTTDADYLKKEISVPGQERILLRS